MLIFHEGLPGSGKSYEAVVNRVIPALKSGRQVFAYIEGLNFDKFSEITDIPLSKLKGFETETDITGLTENQRSNHKYVRYYPQLNKYFSVEYSGLLHQLTSDDVPIIHDKVANDSLVIIDELQDFFPVGNRRLSDDITSFVTQHRHRGLDIVAMGQDHRDCHNLWKRRIDQMISFTKQDVIGRVNNYTWQTYKLRNGSFHKLRSGTSKYDSQYFGLYASYSSGVSNTETYTDDRTNIFKSSAFRIGLPAFLVVLFVALSYVYSFFSGGVSPVSDDQLLNPPEPLKVSTESEVIVQRYHNQSSQPKEHKRTRSEILEQDFAEGNYILKIASSYRPRLAGLIHNEHKTVATIEFLDDSFHAKEVLNLKQLQGLGWDFKVKAYGLLIYKENHQFVVTAWPLDVYGRVSERERERI